MLEIREINETDKEWLRSNSSRLFNGEIIVSRSIIHQIFQKEGFIALLEGIREGVAIYDIVDERLELVSIEVLKQWQGIGSALIERLQELARAKSLKEIWLITTNDNLDALRFYQKRGFKLRAVYPGALEESRKVKAAIPMTGHYGIKLTDEIELYMEL